MCTRKERCPRIERVQDGLFEGEEAVLHVIERIVAPLGLRVDESSPYADARLPDGSRVQTRFLRNPLSRACLIYSDGGFTRPGSGSRVKNVRTSCAQRLGTGASAKFNRGADVGHAPARRVYAKAGHAAFPSTLFFKVL
jgi:hypothetical protein